MSSSRVNEGVFIIHIHICICIYTHHVATQDAFQRGEVHEEFLQMHLRYARVCVCVCVCVILCFLLHITLHLITPHIHTNILTHTHQSPTRGRGARSERQAAAHSNRGFVSRTRRGGGRCTYTQALAAHTTGQPQVRMCTCMCMCMWVCVNCVSM
jgi:hypothetical protein